MCILKKYRQFILFIAITTAIAFGASQRIQAQEDISAMEYGIFLPIIVSEPDTTSSDLSQVDISKIRNNLEPNYVPSQDEMRREAEKLTAMEAHMAGKLGQDVQTAAVNSSNSLPVGTWLEPNDYAHRNYCGPGATQVALDARLPSSSVPSVDVLGTEENIDPNWGVYMNDVCPVLNNRLGVQWYVVSTSTASASDLANRLVSNVDSGYATVTGVKTGSMPGWSGYNVNHIVAVPGYSNWSAPSSGNAEYKETSGSVAGYGGSYSQSVSFASFWGSVSANNVMCW